MCGCQNTIATFMPERHSGLRLYTDSLAVLREPERSLPVLKVDDEIPIGRPAYHKVSPIMQTTVVSKPVYQPPPRTLPTPIVRPSNPAPNQRVVTTTASPTPILSKPAPKPSPKPISMPAKPAPKPVVNQGNIPPVPQIMTAPSETSEGGTTDKKEDQKPWMWIGGAILLGAIVIAVAK